jgi:hypothetical protein
MYVLEDKYNASQIKIVKGQVKFEYLVQLVLDPHEKNAVCYTCSQK